MFLKFQENKIFEDDFISTVDTLLFQFIQNQQSRTLIGATS